MNLNVKTFDQIVTDTVTAIQSQANSLIDFTIGSIMRSLAEANSTLVIWIQGQILTLLTAIRASTCSGADLDSWCADYNFTRLPSVAATGQVTFARFTTTQSAFIPAGTQIQTSDVSAEIFSVTADTANVNYNSTLGGYTIAIGVASISVPVQCTTGGVAGNVLAGQCNVLKNSIPYVDTVTNPSAFTNGADAETDTAMRTRFALYISTLSKATKSAIGNAILAVQLGLTYSLVENQSYAGATQLGYFYVVVDDGSGTPPSPLLTSVNNAVDAVRPFTSTFGVYAPIVTTATVSMTITTDSGYTHSAVVSLVQSALNAYIAALPLGTSLPYSRLAQVAYDASPGVTNVSSVVLNGGTADLTADAKHVIKPGTITVT